MIVYNKAEIREKLTLDNIYELLTEFGGEPKYTSFGIISATICHNEPGVGSHKLYYYSNSGLFKCFTGCDSFFDIFELVIKVQKIQQGRNFDLNDAVRWVASHFGFGGRYEDQPDQQLEDWKIFSNYERIETIELKTNQIVLKEYDPSILDRFNYSVKIQPWLNDNICQEALTQNRIGFYPGQDMITIPHFDKNNRFVGLRGRALVREEAELYGKYRPLKINRVLYSHPLGMNLYNLNNSKNNIQKIQKAIVFEGEKSCLQYQTYFGIDNDISVACCGSSISNYQIQLLLEENVSEIIIAFDRQFQEISDTEFTHLKNNLIRLREKYKNDCLISFIFDKNMITGYKDSPTDNGKDIFLKLFKERIIL